MFNPEEFKKSVTTEQGSTKIIPCPVGEYPARIEKIDFRQAQGKKNPNETYTFLDATIEIDSAQARQACDREKVTVRYSGSVDLTQDGNGLDMAKGKNIALNRLREAVGQNVAGQPWSPTMLEGKVLKVKVKHRSDENDPSTFYAEVAAVAPLA